MIVSIKEAEAGSHTIPISQADELYWKVIKSIRETFGDTGSFESLVRRSVRICMFIIVKYIW